MCTQTQTRIGFLTVSVAVLAVAAVAGIKIRAWAAVAPLPTPAANALSATMHGVRDAATSGACCELLGGRCFNYLTGSLDAEPVSTVGCESHADCTEEVASTCGAPGQCICLPHYICTDDVLAEDCQGANQRYGGDGTICEQSAEFPQIDPPCGQGACCAYDDNCSEGQIPIECVGGISDGDSAWLGDGSECSDLPSFEDAECPKACPINGVCHPDLIPPCIPGDGHPNDAATVLLADSTDNGICSTSGGPCQADTNCLGGPDVCLGGDVQVVADTFSPVDLSTSGAVIISGLCWWGIYLDEDQDDCSVAVAAAGDSTFTIRILQDADGDTSGLPDTPVATFVDVVVDRSGTGFGDGDPYEWEFHATINTTTAGLEAGACYFLEIAATNSPDNCDFWSGTSTVGDKRSAVDNDADGVYDQATTHGLAWLVDVGVSPDDCGCTCDEDCPDDGLFCNGEEYCNLDTHKCDHRYVPGCPDDGIYCNGTEFCDEAADTCGHTGDPCDPPFTWCNTAGATCDPSREVVEVQSCMTHGCDDPDYWVMCLDIGCDGGDPPYDNVEPRLQLGTPPGLWLHCDGPVAPDSTTVGVSCIRLCTMSGLPCEDDSDCLGGPDVCPPDFGGTATVIGDGTPEAKVRFGEMLPDQSCCTLALGPVALHGILGQWTIVMLEGDVNYDCMVSTADASSVKARLEQSAPTAGAQYDVNRDCIVLPPDKSSVKQRLGNLAPCP